MCFALLAAAAPARGEEPAGRPVVVLVGDSIRLGYAPIVAEKLQGVAEVVSPTANGGDSANVLKHLDEWVIRRKPAVVHFNAGLHDLKTDARTGAKQVSLDAYRRNLAEIIQRLDGQTAARMVFATTTPILDDRHKGRKSGFDRTEADVAEYNRAAREVLARNPIVAVDDLHALVERLDPEKALLNDGTHYTPEAYRALGERVAASIRQALDGPAATREGICRRAPSPPTIDGRLDDPAWNAAVVIDRFPAFWRDAPSGDGTRARLLWDDDALYFSATMTDVELRSFGTRRNDTLWEGDVFEFFLKPFDDRPEYYEFQVNPKSVFLELPFAHRGEDFRKVAALPTLGMTAVAVCDGTPDRPGDLDRGWAVEGRIPWSAFTRTGGRPHAGDTWRFALCRYDYGPVGTAPVTMSSAPLRRPSFHRYEDYGRLRFEGPGR
jgi:lysophospholipase L1-like esterase